MFYVLRIHDPVLFFPERLMNFNRELYLYFDKLFDENILMNRDQAKTKALEILYRQHKKEVNQAKIAFILDISQNTLSYRFKNLTKFSDIEIEKVFSLLNESIDNFKRLVDKLTYENEKDPNTLRENEISYLLSNEPNKKINVYEHFDVIDRSLKRIRDYLVKLEIENKLIK